MNEHVGTLVRKGKDALRGAFLEAMSHTAATVSIVTTDGPSGRAGVTVSAMTSVSADTPAPSLLICVHQRSRACPAILRNGVFCVNVLTDEQVWVSDVFAGRANLAKNDKFSCAQWVPLDTGAPRLVDPLVAFDCRLTHSELLGTHYLMFGEVQDVFIAKGGMPLIYTRRAYGMPVNCRMPVDKGRRSAEPQRQGFPRNFRR